MAAQITAPTTKNSLATVSLALGIVSLVLFLGILTGFGLFLYLSFLVSIAAAVITGGIALGSIKAKNQTGKRAAVAGLVMGIIGLLLFVFFFFIILPAISIIFEQMQSSLNTP